MFHVEHYVYIPLYSCSCIYNSDNRYVDKDFTGTARARTSRDALV